MSYAMQINIPASIYGDCFYAMPEGIHKWLYEQKLAYAYSHSTSSGNSYYTNGKSNIIYSFTVKDIDETDGLAFKMQFPNCDVCMFAHAEKA